MECRYCGKTLKDNELNLDKYKFCNADCKKKFNYYILEDTILKFCNAPGNHCEICPIDEVCSFYMKIEKEIKSDDDILKYDIPTINKLRKKL